MTITSKKQPASIPAARKVLSPASYLGSKELLVSANLALAVVYIASGKFGLSLAFLNLSASAVWPPTGVSLAALLLWGPRLWPGVFLGAFVVNMTTQGTLVTSLWIAAGNTLEAVVGRWLVTRYAGGVECFERTGTFFRYALYAVLLSTMTSPTVGLTALCVHGVTAWGQYAPVWLTWWLGDMVSNLLIAPLLLIWWRQGWPRLTGRRILEAGALFVTLGLVGYIVFWNNPAGLKGYPILYVTIPPLLWAGFRLGERGAITAVLLMAGLALSGTLRGHGPFAWGQPNESLLFLQAFVGTITLTGLALALAVAERKRTAETLRQSEARVQLQAVALESAANAILITDRHGRIEWVNGAFTRLTGYTATEAIGRNPRFLKSDLHDPAYYRQMWETVLAGRVWYGEVVNTRKDGSLYTEEMTITPVLSSGRHESHFIAIKQDVTERKRAETSLREAKEQLAGANAHLEDLVNERTARLQEMVAELEHFSYSLVHDMRAPLRGIQGFAGLILEESGESLRPAVLAHLLRIRKAAARMDQLITDALSYSKAVRTELPVRPVDVAALLRGIIESYPDFADATIEVQGEFPRVLGNEAGLTQSLSNLLHNAVKFVKPGESPRVRVWAEKQGSVVRIVVEDRGVGIPQEGLSRIFGMFQRMHGADYDGTGIGLALVRKVMERMGGRVGVSSQLGQGSRFWLELPCAQPTNAATAHPSESTSAPTGSR